MKFTLTNKTILIVEDYPIMRKSIKDMLYTLGAQYIFEAENGAAGITAMNKQKFDIVLCDYNLGEGKNGQQVLEEAKYNKLISYHSLFIIVSAHQSTTDVLSTIENKPDEYLAKPFNAQQLFRRIEQSHQRKQWLSVIEKEIDKGNLDRAIIQCDELLSNNIANRSQLLKLRAELAIKVGDFETATAIYDKKLEQRELSWARLGTGIIAFFQHKHEEAINIFQQIIVQNPMLMDCYDWLAKSYEIIERFDDAEATLYQATIISPHSFFRQKKLALMADKTGNIEIAEKAYKIVTELAQYSVHKSPSDFSGLAKVYSKLHKEKEALQLLDDMRHHFSGDPEAELRISTLESEIYQNIGESQLSGQAFQKTQSLYSQLKDRTPQDLQIDVAKVCYLNNNDELADKIISSLIHNHIDNNSFINDIQHMQRDIGKDNYSEELINQTKQELININNQGVKLFEQGNLKEAFEIFESAIEKMPHNKTIIFNMAKITLHDLKTTGVTEENLLLAHRYIQKAKQVGIADDKLGSLQVEFERATKTAVIHQ